MPNSQVTDRVRAIAPRRFGIATVVLVVAVTRPAASQTPLSTGVMPGDRAAHACVDTMSDA